MKPLNRMYAVDLGLAAVALALSFSVLIGFHGRNEFALGAVWWLAAAHSLPVAARRRWPRSAFVVSSLAGFVYLVMGLPMVGLGLTGMVMIYTLAAEVPRRESLAGLVAMQVGLVAALLVASTDMHADTMIGNAVVLVAVWLIGDSSRRRRESVVLEREAAAQRAVAEERLRIARELHDIVAHTMSVISVQAGMARMVIDDDPARAQRSLSDIEAASRDALNEMRRLLHVLRSEDGARAALAPAPGLSDLETLIDQARGGGTSVEMHVRGEPRALPASVELAAYRVVQEALTNVRRHSPGAGAEVTITYGDDGLLVEVENELVRGAVASVGAGHGVSGMKERVELHRGVLTAGANGDGTYRVVASFPYDEVIQ